MKITIESYGITRSIETDHDDLTFIDFMDKFKELIVGMYSEGTLENYFNEQ